MVLGGTNLNYQTQNRAEFVDRGTNSSKLAWIDMRTHSTVMGNDKANYVTEAKG